MIVHRLLASVFIGAGLTACALPGWNTAKPEPGTAKVVQPDPFADGSRAISSELALRGMFTRLAEVAVFRDCRSQRYWPVAPDAAYPVLERVYQEARLTEGDPLLVRIRGRVEERPPAPSTVPGESLIVLEFLGARPDESCGTPMTQPMG